MASDVQAPPRVSIVIPTYNHADLLREALQSVIAQTLTDWEAIVVNNHSEDHTVDVVKAFGDPRLRLEHIHNQGIIAASRNKGISLSRGEWVAFLDSDDSWEPDKLERSLTGAGADADLISHREAVVRDGKVLSVSPRFEEADAAYRRLLFDGTCFSPSAALVRRTLLEKIGGFREDPDFVTVEDYDLWLRLVQAGAKVRFVDAVLSSYRLHDGNASASIVRHMNAGLLAVETHYRALTPKRALDGLRLRARRAMIIYGAARSFQKSSRRADALRHYMKSLVSYPLNPRALMGAAATLLPRGSRGINGG